MYKKTLIILGLITFLCAIATVFVVARHTETNIEPQASVPATLATYVSAETNDTITVKYLDNKAVLNGIGYREVSFLPVEAASGAKYESKETNLTLWSKGNEVTVSRGRQTLFVGTDVNQEAFEENNWADIQSPEPDQTQSTSTEPVVEEGPQDTASTSEAEAVAEE